MCGVEYEDRGDCKYCDCCEGGVCGVEDKDCKYCDCCEGGVYVILL